MSDEPGAYIYMLQCSDGSYYVGSTRKELEQRISEHNAGTFMPAPSPDTRRVEGR